MLVAAAVLEFNLLFIFSLAKIFFYKPDGKVSLMWFVTAGPFTLCLIAVALLATGHLGPIWTSGRLAEGLAAVGCVFAAGSCALIGLTLGTHRVPLALWHQANDAPKSIVTFGAYKRIRHPFYSSFLLCLSGAVLAFPHPATVACLVYGLLILTYTARREERRLATSSFGEEYRRYMARTGRFFPRLIAGGEGGA